MNWYKKATSWNIRTTENFIDKCCDIADEAYKFVGQKFAPAVYNKITFFNLYTNQEEYFDIIIQDDKREAIANYNVEKKIMTIYPNSLNDVDMTNETKGIEAIEKAAIHEFTHAIDPKFKQQKFIEKQKNLGQQFGFDYYNFPTEFDAYSKQITEDIKGFISADYDNNFDIVYNWVMTTDHNIPEFLIDYNKIILAWRQYDNLYRSRYIRKFKQRLYNEIILPRLKERKEEQNNVN